MKNIYYIQFLTISFILKNCRTKTFILKISKNKSNNYSFSFFYFVSTHFFHFIPMIILIVTL